MKNSNKKSTCGFLVNGWKWDNVYGEVRASHAHTLRGFITNGGTEFFDDATLPVSVQHALRQKWCEVHDWLVVPGFDIAGKRVIKVRLRRTGETWSVVKRSDINSSWPPPVHALVIETLSDNEPERPEYAERQRRLTRLFGTYDREYRRETVTSKFPPHERSKWNTVGTNWCLYRPTEMAPHDRNGDQIYGVNVSCFVFSDDPRLRPDKISNVLRVDENWCDYPWTVQTNDNWSTTHYHLIAKHYGKALTSVKEDE